MKGLIFRTVLCAGCLALAVFVLKCSRDQERANGTLYPRTNNQEMGEASQRATFRSINAYVYVGTNLIRLRTGKDMQVIEIYNEELGTNEIRLH